MDFTVSRLALACLDCQTGHDSRSLALGVGFVPHLFGALAPYVLLLAMLAFVLRGIDRHW